MNRPRSSLFTPIFPALWLCVAAGGCSDPVDDDGSQAATDADTGSTSSGGDTSGSDSSGSDTSTSDDTSSSGDGSGESSSGGVDPGLPGEIGLDRVTLNQGTGLTIADAGEFLSLSADAPRLVGADVLLGMISPSGDERWIVVPGPAGFVAEVAESTIELRLGEVTLVQPGTAHQVADGDDLVVMAALPPGGIEAAELPRLKLGAVVR